MGATHSLVDQLDCVGPESVVNSLSQCRLVDVQTAICQLAQGPSAGQPRINSSTLALNLPLPISTATAFVHLLEDKDTNSTDVTDCFNVLTFFGCGSVEERIRLFYTVHDWGLETEVDKSALETALLRLLHCVDRVYQADPWIKITNSSDGLYNLLNVADELVEEIECLAQRPSFHHTDLEKWLMSSLSACFSNEAMYTTQHCDKDDSASIEHAANNTSGGNTSSYTWVKVASDDTHVIPSCRSKHALAVHDGYVYLYGGRDRNIGHKDLWRFEIASNQWERMTCSGDRPFLLQEHSMIAYNGKLYVFGGEFSASWSNEAPLWTLDIAEKRWSKPKADSEVSVPCGRRGHTAVITNHQMHIYGGFLDLKGSTSELWTYDLEHAMWHLTYRAGTADDGPGSRHSHSAVVHNNGMWVYGGMADLIPRSDFWCWHFKQRKWTKYKSKNGPPALAGHSACKVPSGMVIYGGETSGVLQSDLWHYTFDTQTWQKLSCEGLAPGPRSQHCTVVLPSFILQQAWLAAGNDRSRSVPLLKPDHQVPADDQPRPKSSPAGNLSNYGFSLSNYGYASFRNTVAPIDVPLNLSIGTPGDLDRTPTVTPKSVEDTVTLIKQVTDKLGRFSKSTDAVQVLKVEEEYNKLHQAQNSADTTAYSANTDGVNVESRAEEIRKHIRQMRKTKTIDSVSLCRLLSTGSESSEEWLSYDNCVSLENSGHFSRLNSMVEDDGRSPMKRPKSHSVTDSGRPMAVHCEYKKSASVESILSMSHNPKLPPPHWLNKRDISLSRESISFALRSHSWDSLLKSFGGVGLSCIDIETDPQAVEMTNLNHSDHLILEDLEDCDINQFDLTPTPGSPQKVSPTQPHIGVAHGLSEQSESSIPNAWIDVSGSTQTEELPDLLVDVASEDPIMAYHQSCVKQDKVPSNKQDKVPSNKQDNVSSLVTNQNRPSHRAQATAGRQIGGRSDGSIELTNMSNRRKAQVVAPPGGGLRKYLSHMGVRTCDTVHIYIFGGKEAESLNIGIKPLPVWRLDVCELSTRRHNNDKKK